jgi:hypothetical protein
MQLGEFPELSTLRTISSASDSCPAPSAHSRHLSYFLPLASLQHRLFRNHDHAVVHLTNAA